MFLFYFESIIFCVNVILIVIILLDFVLILYIFTYFQLVSSLDLISY